MEKEEYLQYFFSTKKKQNSTSLYQSNSIKSFKRTSNTNGSKKRIILKEKKMLPHIEKQYDYKITNQLLLQKIMHPKRDKIISGSFHQNQHSINRQGQIRAKASLKKNISYSQENMRKIRSLKSRKSIKKQSINMSGPTPGQDSKIFQSTIHSPISGVSRVRRQKDKSSKSYQKQFNIMLQNDRMGRRIINTKSSVEDILKKTFYTYKNQISHISQSNNNRNHDDRNSSNITQKMQKTCFIRGKDNKKYFFSGKINNGVKVFFNKISEQNSFSKQQNMSRDNKSGSFSHRSPNSKNKIVKYYLQNNDSSSDDSDKQNSLKPHQNSHLKSRDIKTSVDSRFYSKQQNNFLKLAEPKYQKQGNNHMQTHYPQCFKVVGKGPTILMLYNFEIECNPKLIDSTILLFELITSQSLVGVKKFKQKCLRSPLMPYQFLNNSHPPQNMQIQDSKQKQNTLNCVKFGINISQIGDFVPLRIYKVNGVNLQELGMIDINLSAYKMRQQYQLSDKILTQHKVNEKGQTLERKILTGMIVEDKLRKRKINKVDIKVKFQYQIYSKRFK